MSKNLTRKGLAFGALVALGSSLIAGAPASAAGVNDGSVSLAPNAGTAYSVLTDGTFDLKANYDASLTAASRYLKFLVTDSGEQIRVDGDINGTSTAGTTYVHAIGVTAGSFGSANVLTVTAAGHNFSTGDIITIGGTTFSAGTGGDMKADYSVTRVDADTFTVATSSKSGAVTVSAATATFKSTGITAATGVVATGDDSITLTVDNAAHFLVGDTVDFSATALDDAGSAHDFKATTGLTVSAVDDATNKITVTKTSLAVAAGAFATITAAELVVNTPTTDTALSSRASLAGKALGNWRVLGASASTVSARNLDKSFVVRGKANSVATDDVLRLVNSDDSESYSVEVTAWVDNNGNNEIDSTEKVSPTRTVNFYANAQLTAVTTLDAPVLGALTLTGNIAISPELNGQQVGDNAAEVTTTWTVQSGTALSANTATYNTTTKVWDIVGDLNSTDVVVVGNYTAKASVNGAAIGNTASASVGARTAVDTELKVAASNDTTYVKSTSSADTLTSKVRPGKSATVVITGYAANAVPLAAGKAVTVAFSSATTTTDWTINGVKVLDNAASGSKVYTTDANGQVTLTVSSTSGLNADTIKLEASAENVAATGGTEAANADATLTWETPVYAIVDLNAPAALTSRTVNKLGSVTYDLYAGDQWNAPLTGDYRLYVSTTGRTTTAANYAFATGRTTVTITDAGLGSTSTIVVSSELQKQTSGVWAASDAATAFAQNTITASDAPVSALVPATTYVGGDSAAPADLTPTTAIAAYNAELTQGAFTSPAGTKVATIALAGTGVSQGDTVTISGAGLSFGYVDNTTIKAIGNGTLTVVVDDLTNDEFVVFSNKYVKDAVVTVASRGRTGTSKVTFTTAAATAGTTLSITGADLVKAGRTLQITGTLTDAFGNAVKTNSAVADLKVTYTGPGFVVNGLPTETDEDGKFTLSVLFATEDSGVATIKAVYGGSKGAIDSTIVGKTADIVSSKSVLVGMSATVSAGSKKANVVVKNASGTTVTVVSGTKSVTKVATSDSFKVSLTKLTAGKKTVKVYVNDVLVSSKSVTVKK
jgi:hypothetical protein